MLSSSINNPQQEFYRLSYVRPLEEMKTEGDTQIRQCESQTMNPKQGMFIHTWLRKPQIGPALKLSHPEILVAVLDGPNLFANYQLVYSVGDFVDGLQEQFIRGNHPNYNLSWFAQQTLIFLAFENI